MSHGSSVGGGLVEGLVDLEVDGRRLDKGLLLQGVLVSLVL